MTNTCLGTRDTSTMGYFCENSKRFKTINYFQKKAL